MSTENGMPVHLMAWRALVSGSLLGFAKIRLGKSMIINDVAVHCSHGKSWAQAPGKPMVGKDGVALRGDNGRIRYSPVIEWTDKAAADRFSEAVCAAVELGYPGGTKSDYAP